MKPNDPLPAPSGPAVCCDIAAHSVVRVTPGEIPALRQRPGAHVIGADLPTSFLKHADEQSVVGLGAVFRAIHAQQLDPHSFADWGVVAAPRFLGRATLTTALQRFAAEGAWGISPHLIPHRSLHAVSGTVSQALRIHGPNFGVGGGPDSALEGILAGAALSSEGRLPGVWVVLTEWCPEPTPDRKGQVPADSMLLAVVLGLIAPQKEFQGRRLRVLPRGVRGGPSIALGRESFTLEGLCGCLEQSMTAPATVIWSLASGGRIELESQGTNAHPLTSQRLRLPAEAGTEKRQ